MSDQSGGEDGTEYETFEGAVRTMREVLDDEEELRAAVLSLQFANGTGDMQFATRDDTDYWTVNINMLAHRVEALAEQADVSTSEMLADIGLQIENRREVREESE